MAPDAEQTEGDTGDALLAPSFQPIDRSQMPPRTHLPDELWLTILASPCTFPPDIFTGVMLNLIKNPNITSSHLFRADIFYDSEKDQPLASINGSFVSHLKPEYRPLSYDIPGFELMRTIVRQMVPRNPQLDKPLVQTCHFLSKDDDQGEENVVVYLPHVQERSELPFYHPAVSRLAFSHTWNNTSSPTSSGGTHLAGTVSVSYCLFPTTSLTTKLSRTALRLLETVHKHGQGQLKGYEKRVHLDQIIPQKRYQDTYARLKAKYGRLLSDNWVEVTDPGKHVFEDIGIAAYLIELWRDIYAAPKSDTSVDGRLALPKRPFPGFVDIGCGNGVLTYILLAEGYEGWGFDARERKTWSTFPSDIRFKLQRRILVPSIFQTSLIQPEAKDVWHDGIFDRGTFIISNHADELTAWTPLLAHLNDSAFIAIPCCSHDLAGSRFRAPPSTKAPKASPARLPQQHPSANKHPEDGAKSSQAAETGSLKRTEAQKKMPSAYSTLCSYVTSLAEEVGFEPEKDVLRIPSTRNQCLVGRRVRVAETEMNERLEVVKGTVERELGRGVQAVGREWIERAERLAKKPGSGH